MLKRGFKSIHKYIPTRVQYLFVTLVSLFFLFTLLNLIFPLDDDLMYGTIIYSDKGEIIHAYLSYDEKWRFKAELDEITPDLKKAIIFKEDRFFYYHPGVNILAIVRALYNNLRFGKRTSGASTITMQVARLLEPKARTYGNKLIEIFRAFQLEWKYSKSEIIQLYLNLVPYGGNIEGVKAASLLYFQKVPKQLSLAEVSTLAIIPNRPTSLKPDRNSETLFKARNKWLAKFREKEVFSEEAIQDALEEPVEMKRISPPKLAPHFSRRLKKEHENIPNIHSTLDIAIQNTLEKLSKSHVQSLGRFQIYNAAVMVIDNKNGSVLAYVGSSDFYDSRDAGQVDGIQAIRSPGSTLKPLLYGLAFDQGLLTPSQRVLDVPSYFGNYSPENYDSQYHGKVSVSYALSNSLNIPAVRVLDKLGTGLFIDQLIKTDFAQINHDKNHLGLSMVLGGCGVSLEELTNLYSSFARDGSYRKPVWLKGDSSSTEFQVLSPGANYMMADILTKATRPDLPQSWQKSKNLPKVAWKTGTSYGRRDAWSIGFNPYFTVGVWVGNFSGRGVPELNGSDMAAPLLFRIFNSLRKPEHKQWFTEPHSLEYRKVCSESGHLPGAACQNLEWDFSLPGRSSTKVCDHMHWKYISSDSSISYCMHCLPDSGHIMGLFPNYKPEYLQYLIAEQRGYIKTPAHNPDCERPFEQEAPVINSPISDLEYLLHPEDSKQLKLACQTAPDVHTVYWYINDRFLRESKAEEEIFIQPPEGRLKISCSDDKGRNTDIEISVKYVAF